MDPRLSVQRTSTLCSIVLALALSGCATARHPASEKNEAVLIDARSEVQIGRSMFENIIKKKTPALADPSKQLYIHRIGQKLAQQSGRRDIVYHFSILDSPDLGTFALPGGYICIDNGLFNKLDEEGLAALLAHEVAHVALKHPIEKMRLNLGTELLMGLALAGFDKGDPVLVKEIDRASPVVFDLLARGYSQEDELSADHWAVEYLKGAGYDPHALAKVLLFFVKENGKRAFETSSTPGRMKGRIKEASFVDKRPKP